MFDTVKLLYSHYYNIKEIVELIKIINISEDNITLEDKIYKRLKQLVFEGGCVYIKFIQWYVSNLKSHPGNKNIEKLVDYLENVFNQCPYHSLDISKEIFRNNFNMELEEYVDITTLKPIASGSIGQVYTAKRLSDNKLIAIKVKHPNVNKEVEDFKIISKYISYLQGFDYFRRNYNLCFNFEKFMDNILLQIDFNIEAYNCKKFKKLYSDNKYVYFPEIYFHTKNIIVSEYVETISFDTFSDFQKSMIALNFTCLIYDMVLIKNFIHADLHIENWGVREFIDDDGSKKYSIVVFDCGICIYSKSIDFNRDLLMAFESNDAPIIIESLKNFLILKNDTVSIEILEKKWVEFMKAEGIDAKNIMNIVLELMNEQNILFDDFLLSVIIVLVLIEDILLKNNIIKSNSVKNEIKDDNHKVENSNLFYHIRKIDLDIYTFANQKNSYTDLAKYKKKKLNRKQSNDKLFGKLNAKIKYSPLP
jgi:predicted unusual protein kinase regulating ubiquinone biosynthesis (AarF/ABC1/UbiB family)